MQAVSANKNRWGFTFKPFFDGTDLAIHNANLSKAGRTFFDFILTKLDGKRRNLMTIPFSDTEFAQRFNYSESRARHARLEVVDAKLAEQHFGRTKSGHRIVGKFCFKLVLPNTNDTPLNSPSPPIITPESPSASPPQYTQQPQPDEPPVSAKVAESQPEKWLGVSHKSGQELATFSESQIPEPHAPTEFDEHTDPNAIDVVLDVYTEDSLSSIDICNVNSKSYAQALDHQVVNARERRAAKTPKPQESVPNHILPPNPVAEKFISECMGRSRIPKEIFQRVAVEMDSTVSDIKLDLGIGHDKAVEVAQNACDALVENIKRVRSMKMFDETDYWQKAIDKAKDLFSYPIENSSSNDSTETSNTVESATHNSDNSSASADQNADEGVSDALSYLETGKEGSTTGETKHTPTRAEIDAELLATWDDNRWLDWVDEHVNKCVRVRQMLCGPPLDATPYTDAEIEEMREQLLGEYPETDETRLAWIEQRKADFEAKSRMREPELMAKVSEKWQKRFKTPTAYISDYCQRNRHRKTLSPIETTRLFRAVQGQVTCDEIEDIQRSCYENWQWEKKNERWEKVG